jgi:predicted ester cyclase
MTTDEMKLLVCRHFEDFVNNQDPTAAERNFAPEYEEHGSDSPRGSGGSKTISAAAFRRFPDIHVSIDDIIAEGDKVVVRNTWRATDSIVIWRIAHGLLVERWA